LISPTRVLTSAQCVATTNPPRTVFVGGNRDKTNPGQEVSVIGYSIHPGYQINDNNGDFKNDVAVLLLARRMNFPTVTLNTNITLPKTDESVVTIGFGITGSSTDGTNTMSDILQKLVDPDYKVVNSTDCKEAWGNNIDRGNNVICVQPTADLGVRSLLFAFCYCLVAIVFLFCFLACRLITHCSVF